MSITQTLTPFDSTKQPIEGTIEFRANATYAWSWLIEHTNQQIALINQINSTVSDMNSLAQTVTTKAQEVSTNTGIVNQAKIDAQAARDAALNAKSAVETIYDTFDDRYLGSKTTAPTLDNDGNALQSGALYFNSTSGKLFIYDLVGVKWVDITIIPTLLSSLSDVALVNKANNDVLQYDSTSGKWVNRSFYSKAELDAFIDIHSKTAKTTLVDADEMMIADSTTTFSLKKISWASIKTVLMSLFTPRVATTTNKAIARYSSITGDLQNSAITIDDNGNLGSGTQSFNGFGGAGFKNFIINGNFDVWQRGTSFTNPQVTYTADRFISWSGSASTVVSRVNATSGYGLYDMQYSNASNTSFSAVQRIESINAVNFAGKTVTFTARVKTSSTSVTLNIYSANTQDNFGSITSIATNTFTVPANTWTTISYTFIAGGNSWQGLLLDLGTTGTLYSIGFMQLELGSVFTPFEIRPSGLELSLCQRYYEKIFTSLRGYADGAGCYWTLPMKVNKRNTPTIIQGTSFSGQNVSTSTGVIGTTQENIIYRLIPIATGFCTMDNLSLEIISEL